jgi:hypothetical protein
VGLGALEMSRRCNRDGTKKRKTKRPGKDGTDRASMHREILRSRRRVAKIEEGPKAPRKRRLRR